MKVIDTKNAPAAIGPYSQAIVANGFVYTSGQIPINTQTGAVEGKTSWGTSGYNGPQPPFGTHRYIFYLYALDVMIDLPAGSDVQALKNAISGHEIESASLTGMFGVLDNFRK